MCIIICNIWQNKSRRFVFYVLLLSIKLFLIWKYLITINTYRRLKIVIFVFCVIFTSLL